MNESAREIQQIARLENVVEDGLGKNRLGVVLARVARKSVWVVERRVDSPAFAAFELQNECFDVVVVRREALCAFRCQIAYKDLFQISS